MSTDWLKQRTSFDKFDGGEPRVNVALNESEAGRLVQCTSPSADRPTPPSHSLSYDPLPDEIGRACRKLRILLDPTIFCSDALKQCAAIDREGKS